MKQCILKAISVALPLVLKTKGKQHLSILIYHRVLPEYDFMRPSEPTIKEFDWQMSLVSRYFTPLSLARALELMDRGELPENAICVTFDDGYADNESCALPILKKWKIPATVFVSTGFINGGRMWNDTVVETIKCAGEYIDLRKVGLDEYAFKDSESKRTVAQKILTEIKHREVGQRAETVDFIESLAKQSLPNDLMATDQQILNLDAAGVEIGGHTVNHPILAKLNDARAEQEIIDGKVHLESVLSKKLRYFAYPNGKLGDDYLESQVRIVKEAGFEAAVSTTWGVSTRNSDRYQLARFTPWDKSPDKFLLRLLLNQKSVKL
ncbi:polysaccharide deacetylase family protein [Neptunomonas japonica]|uniref:Polysaccharide deacetylase n=1 Tax=Neptunomonas japonica JAMM 1380 TaxID=1441457 RepID=A0A7R6SVJ1_9GAMM|nr:polysaccharide deacetylase family protein [Neptunomonas japonica]BBB28757.1 polysaccharide deacetylase [Neptunomonas japonica JAMM 1380]